ncbi:MAG: histidine kinase dimerization/phosphoacceptor domain -containing protein [Methanobacterium sp.]|nr:histidine kinase dimerization/phosphoacceptor domain -containing protein [Methanobacterium sp.]
MNIYALISFIAFMVCFFLGNFIYHKNPKSQLNIMVAILCLLVGFLAFTEFEYRQAYNYETAYFWLKASTLWPIVPSILLHIAIIFTKKSYFLKNKLNYLLIYLPAIIITALGLTTNLLISGALKQYWGWTYVIPDNSTLFNIMSLWTIIAIFLAAFLCLNYYLKSKNLKRLQAKYMIVGLYLPLIISLVSDVVLPNMSIRVPEMSMTMSTVGLGLISYGIWKYRFPALTTAIAADEIVSTMSNFFILLDSKSNILNVNQATCDLLGYKSDELIGKSIELIFPANEMLSLLERLSNNLSRRTYITNLKSTFKVKSGDYVPVFLSISLIKSDTNEILGVVCVGSDITDIKEAEDKIKSSLKEKELLLQEVHHRVKNNLQIISSLLNLQASYINDEKDLEIFKDSQSRVKSMAFIHEQLYKSSDFTNINFNNYIHNLLAYLSYSHNLGPEKIKMNINVEDISLDINTAIPCGLIINELVTNSIKYAFPGGRSGTINIELHSDYEDEYVLIVGDDGIGLPEDIDFKNTDSLGLQLVNSLSKQLEGYIELDRTNGTQFKIIFNKLKYKDRI